MNNQSYFKNVLIGVLLVAVVILSAIVFMQRSDTDETPPTPTETKTAVLAQAQKVLTALKNKNDEALAQLVHPTKGVRFTPYSYVETTRNITFSREQVRTLFTTTERIHWGEFDGSGEPINLTFNEYYTRFIYSRDFLSAPQTSYDERIGHGNSLYNVPEVYPEAHVVEYHFPGFDPQYGGMDWESLRLVFEEMNGTWYLVGVIHDQWTI